MQWIETIELRTFNNERHELEARLAGLMEELNGSKEEPAMAVYRRAMIDSDFCVQLTYQSEPEARLGSALGLRLMNALQEFGLVYHRVWVDLNAG